MDGEVLVGVDWASLVNGLTNDIDDTAESLGADGHLNGVASVLNGLSTHKTLSGVESDGTHVVATQMLGDLEDETVLGALDLKRVEDRRQIALEFDIDDGTDNLGNLSSGSAESTCYDRQTSTVSVTRKEPGLGGGRLTLGSELAKHL